MNTADYTLSLVMASKKDVSLRPALPLFYWTFLGLRNAIMKSGFP